MSYITLNYYLLTAGILLVYYLLPLSHRWKALLAGSILFYALADANGLPALFWMILMSYGTARVLKRSKLRFILALGVSVLPFWLHLLSQVVSVTLGHLFLPMGLSYLSLQVIAYLADVYTGKTEPETDLLKYALFVSFFPQVVQGPIPRFSRLQPQLCQGNRYEERSITTGFFRILCGLSLKFLIADRAGIPA
ncbi:MAG: hypothetical protein IKS32_12030, partial [Solobacterium sp.]|nr:hypothetical protein [Solobacterium sp.]